VRRSCSPCRDPSPSDPPAPLLSTPPSALTQPNPQGLKPSQESIEIVSKYVLFLRRQARDVARVWGSTARSSPPPQQLLLVYLANDILGKGRKRGIEFLDAFYPVLVQELPPMLAGAPADVRAEIGKVVALWVHARHFGNSGSQELQRIADGAGGSQGPARGEGASGASGSGDGKAEAPAGGGAEAAAGAGAAALRGAALAAQLAMEGAAAMGKAARDARLLAEGLARDGDSTKAYDSLLKARELLERECRARREALAALEAARAEQEALLGATEAAQGGVDELAVAVAGRMSREGGEGSLGEEDEEDEYDPLESLGEGSKRQRVA